MKTPLKITQLFVAGIISSLLLSTAQAGAGGAFDISATKHKKEKTSEDGFIRPNLEHTTESYYYKISVRSTSPNNEPDLSLQYFIYIEKPDGRIVVATKESTPITVSLNVPTKLETKPFEVESLELDRARRDHKVESEIYGYAIRLVNGAGETVAEKLSSSKLKPLVKWAELESETRPTKELRSGPGKRQKIIRRAF